MAVFFSSLIFLFFFSLFFFLSFLWGWGGGGGWRGEGYLMLSHTSPFPAGTSSKNTSYCTSCYHNGFISYGILTQHRKRLKLFKKQKTKQRHTHTHTNLFYNFTSYILYDVDVQPEYLHTDTRHSHCLDTDQGSYTLVFFLFSPPLPLFLFVLISDS